MNSTNKFVFLNFTRSPEEEAVPVEKVIATPEIKSTEESGIVPENVSKSKKKNEFKGEGKFSSFKLFKYVL
jgi:hypothetical protein